MKKIGLLTIGQSPREDITPDMASVIKDRASFIETGALDGLTVEEIAALAPDENEIRLITRLRDGSSVALSEKAILKLMQERIDEIQDKVSSIAILCTGSFPEFRSSVPVITTWPVLRDRVPEMAQRAAVISAAPEQVPFWQERWEKVLEYVKVFGTSPYDHNGALEKTAAEIRSLPVDLVLLDCLGFSFEMGKAVESLSGKKTITARELLAGETLKYC